MGERERKATKKHETKELVNSQGDNYHENLKAFIFLNDVIQKVDGAKGLRGFEVDGRKRTPTYVQ